MEPITREVGGRELCYELRACDVTHSQRELLTLSGGTQRGLATFVLLADVHLSTKTSIRNKQLVRVEACVGPGLVKGVSTFALHKIVRNVHVA